MTQDALKEELSFAEIWLTIQRYKQVVLFTPLVCAVAAIIYVAYFITPQWEAYTILQVGQVGQVVPANQVGQVSQPRPAEPVANAVVRMLAPSFAAGVLSQANLESEDAAKAINDSWLKVTKPKEADLLELKVRGKSSDVARVLALNAVGYLKKSHDELMASSIDAIKAQIQLVNEELEEINSEQELLKKQLLGKHDWSSYEATLAATILQDKFKELRELKNRKLLLAELLGPSTTFSTRLVGDVSVTPVTIKKAFIVALAILVGLIFGLFIAFVRSTIKNEIRK